MWLLSPVFLYVQKVLVTMLALRAVLDLVDVLYYILSIIHTFMCLLQLVYSINASLFTNIESLPTAIHNEINTGAV